MSTIRDAWLRKFATQLPLGIDIKDDDGNVIHSSIGNTKTHKITLYSAWIGKSSGGSTGGNTGGNTGDDGGDTGGTTTNPGHETVGDDVYPGDVNKGEVTKRFKLWQGPSNTNADTTVTFNKDLGENLDGLGDGLQARISMIETPYLNGKATNPRTIQITNSEADLNKFSTTSPVPISLKKGRLASKDTLKVELDGEGSKETIYMSNLIPVSVFKTQQDSGLGARSYYTLGQGYTNNPTDFNAGSITHDSFTISLITVPEADSVDRSGTRLVVYKNGQKCAFGLYNSKEVMVNGLTPDTKYPKGTFTFAYEDHNGGKSSNVISINEFSTNSLPEKVDISSIPSISNIAGSGSVTPYMDGCIIQHYTVPKGLNLAVLDSDNNILSIGSIGSPVVYLENLEPNKTYERFYLAYVLKRDRNETDELLPPSVSFKYQDDGTALLTTSRGQLLDEDKNIISNFDIVVNSVNSYTSQQAITQLAPNTYVFVGQSNDVQLSNVDKNFDNIGDGLKINFSEQYVIWTNIRGTLASMGFPKSIKIPKDKIMGGVTTISLLDEFFSNGESSGVDIASTETYANGVWKTATASSSISYTVSSSDLAISLQNGSLQLTGTVSIGKSNVTTPKKINLQIASVSTYREGE